MKGIYKYIGHFIWYIFLIYACYTICRIIFLFDNWDSFNYLTISDIARLCRGGIIFDTAFYRLK